ncbi:hypothetical protein OUZ56_001200 [Daphnia magna]|uniref:Uncharacterized protein n=1 Tax=Daphnia magna TaxID=35525 RepID=A0ABR0A1Y4_9CRUS|nr:hypothetical protein OUZ56_001200 [Daphnia magna]
MGVLILEDLQLVHSAKKKSKTTRYRVCWIWGPSFKVPEISLKIYTDKHHVDFSGSNRGLFCTRLEGEMTLAVAELLTELTSEVTTPLFLFNVIKSLVVFFCTDAALASKKEGGDSKFLSRTLTDNTLPNGLTTLRKRKTRGRFDLRICRGFTAVIKQFRPLDRHAVQQSVEQRPLRVQVVLQNRHCFQYAQQQGRPKNQPTGKIRNINISSQMQEEGEILKLEKWTRGGHVRAGI